MSEVCDLQTTTQRSYQYHPMDSTRMTLHCTVRQTEFLFGEVGIEVYGVTTYILSTDSTVWTDRQLVLPVLSYVVLNPILFWALNATKAIIGCQENLVVGAQFSRLLER